MRDIATKNKKLMAFPVKSADMLILSGNTSRRSVELAPTIVPGDESLPPRAVSAGNVPEVPEIPIHPELNMGHIQDNVPDIADMLASLNSNVEQIPENVRKALEEERSFKELTPHGIEFVKTLETNPKRKIQQEERMIEFRHVVAGIFKTYDLFSNDVIHAKLRSLSDLLCYHAKKIFKGGCKTRQEMAELRHKVVFTCMSYYLLKRHVISDNVQQYHVLNTIIEASILHTPRHIRTQSRKKYSFYY